MTTTRVPAIWVHTTNDAFNLPRLSDSLSFLSPEQQARLERIRQARMLYDGKHREYFLDEGRTQFDFPQVRAGPRVLPLYLTYNVLGLISLKGADLLFGQSPMLRAADDAQHDALSKLVERSSLHALFYACAVDASYEGECFLEACAKNGQAYLAQVPADEIFPLGDRGPDGQYDRYVRYRVKNVGTDEEPLHLLLEILYAPGRIERRCFQLDERGGRREVSLSQWSSALTPATRTGIAATTITWIPNNLVRGRPVSDYDGAIELQ